jgi:hypothetical protein
MVKSLIAYALRRFGVGLCFSHASLSKRAPAARGSPNLRLSVGETRYIARLAKAPSPTWDQNARALMKHKWWTNGFKSQTGTADGWPLPIKGFSDLKDAA